MYISENSGYIIILTLVFGLFCVVGCTNKSGSIPTNVSQIHVPTFQNSSSEPTLEEILTDDVIQEFLADGRVSLVSRAEAEAILLGTIKQYKHIPLMYNDQDIVQQYKVRIEISLALKDAKTGTILWRQPEIRRETRYSDVQPPVETELNAQERVSEQLARDVLTSTVEGWPYFDLDEPQ